MLEESESKTAFRTLDWDPYSAEFILDPHEYLKEVLDAGPVVRLSRYDIWAAGRHADVLAILGDPKTFVSARGVGISDFKRETPWRKPSILLESDEPLHTRIRAPLNRIVSPAALKRLREEFQAEAEKIVDRVVQIRRFDAVKELAEPFPLTVFPNAIGIDEDGRENLVAYGSLVFNAFGPRNWLLEEALANSGPAVEWVTSKCQREALAPGGLGAQIYESVDSGQVTEEEAALIVRSFLSAGVDTTINGISGAVCAFANNPAQWDELHKDPSLARNAFDEVLRYETTSQKLFRTADRDVSHGGVDMKEGDKVLLFLAAANHDPRRWEHPDRFDIRRRVAGHLAFGTGLHGCVGQMVARLEGELVLAALAKRVKRIELVGKPVRRLNNSLRAYESLPIEVIPA
ncbi:MAG: hypothetical protein QOK29_283 [Rhodospirillaceae bacterium]|nr:hypothetical protein [Rhodospirillaceae bacterium]